MTIKTSSSRQSLLKSLLDPGEASAYPNAATEDANDASEKATKNVAQARKSIQDLHGAMRGTITVAPSVDLTDPTGEVWDAEQ